MRENISNGRGEVDRGPRRALPYPEHYPPKPVRVRHTEPEPMRENWREGGERPRKDPPVSFDAVYSFNGRGVRTNIRSYDPSGAGFPYHETKRQGEAYHADIYGRPMGYQRPAADEPYLDALKEFFDEAISRMEPKPRQNIDQLRKYLRGMMTDRRTTRDIAAELDIDHSTLVKGRQRAVDQFLEVFQGGKEGLAKELRWYLATKGRDVVSRLPGWVH